MQSINNLIQIENHFLNNLIQVPSPVWAPYISHVKTLENNARTVLSPCLVDVWVWHLNYHAHLTSHHTYCKASYVEHVRSDILLCGKFSLCKNNAHIHFLLIHRYSHWLIGFIVLNFALSMKLMLSVTWKTSWKQLGSFNCFSFLSITSINLESRRLWRGYAS